MSVFVQPTDHIDLLVTALVQYEVQPFVPNPTDENHWRRILLDDKDEVGRSLLRENITSVLCREQDGDGGGQVDYTALVESYRFAPTPNPQPTVVALIKACDGYASQSCEHEGWETSNAKALVDGLRNRLIEKLPGYDVAETWSYRRPGTAPNPKKAPEPEAEPEPESTETVA